MLCLPGLSCKDYWQRLQPGGRVPEIPCPDCCQQQNGHGWYERYLDSRLVPIRRLRCSTCCVSHALLPEDLCAYQDLTLPAREPREAKSEPEPVATGINYLDLIRQAYEES